MAATVTTTTTGRIGTETSLSAITVTIGSNSVSYATSLGGLAFDLAQVLITASPLDYTTHPSDIIGFLPIGLSSLGFVPTGLSIGTATYTAVAGASTQGAALGSLSTCPATIRLVGSGTAGSTALKEVADGVNTDSVTGLLLVARGGHNQ